MKRRDLIPRPAVATARSSMAARTGEHCPETGWWVARTASPSPLEVAPKFFVRGSIMPTAHGRVSAWERVAPLGLGGI